MAVYGTGVYGTDVYASGGGVTHDAAAVLASSAALTPTAKLTAGGAALLPGTGALAAAASLVSGSLTTEIITTTGAGTWQVPLGITSITVEGWGGGGSGANADEGNGGGGGGGGAYSRKVIAVTPLEIFDIFVGAGGAGRAQENDGLPGGDTWFDSTSEFLAKGGLGGDAPTGNGGTGGQAAAGVGDTKFSGGDGDSGLSATTAGGGGGGAGDAANGTTATNQNGGAGGTANGGNGGNGGSSSTSGGDRGGGGGGRSDGLGGTSGAGGRGELRISYQTIHQGAVLFTAAASLAAAARATWAGAGVLATAASLTPLAKVAYQLQAVLAAAATGNFNGGLQRNAAALLAGSASMVANGFPTRQGAAVMAGSGSLAAVPLLTLGARAVLPGSASLNPNATTFSIFLEARAPKNFMFHVYTGAGVFRRSWPDVMDFPSFNWPLNSGPGSMQVRLPRPWGAAGEPGESGSAGDIQHGNLVKVFVFDFETPDEGILLYQGTIQASEHNVQGELVELTLVPKTTQFNDYVIHEPVTFTDMDPTDMVEWLVDNDYMPGVTFDATNPLVGLTFSLTFEKGKVTQLLEIIRGLAGGRWYSRLNPDNSLTFNQWDPKVATHSMMISQHVSGDVTFDRSSMDVKKRVLVYGDTGVTGEAILPGYDPAADGAYDLPVFNPRITDGQLARRVAAAELEVHEAPTIGTEFTVLDNHLDESKGWDIESVMPGDTISLRNPTNVFAFAKWGAGHIVGTGAIVGGTWHQQVQHAFVVVQVRYGFDHLEVKLQSIPALLPQELASVNDRLFLTAAR